MNSPIFIRQHKPEDEYLEFKIINVSEEFEKDVKEKIMDALPSRYKSNPDIIVDVNVKVRKNDT